MYFWSWANKEASSRATNSNSGKNEEGLTIEDEERQKEQKEAMSLLLLPSIVIFYYKNDAGTKKKVTPVYDKPARPRAKEK